MVFRHAAKLLTGTGGAQVAALAVMPLLTRLYTTADFGSFGIFLAVCTLSAALVTGRYEGAIPIPKEDGKAWALLRLTLSLSVIGAALGAIGVAVVSWFAFPSFSRVKSLEDGFALFFFGIFFIAATTAMELWLNRFGKYSTVAWNRFIGAVVMAGVQVAAGFLAPNQFWLIGGLLLGTGTTVLLNLRASWRLVPPTYASLGSVAKEYRRFPTYLMLAQVCNSGANHLPTVFVGAFFGAASAGIYTLGNRALSFLDLLVTSVGQVFYQETAARFAREEDCYPLLRTTFLRLVAVACGVFPVVFFTAPPLFAFFFGEEWREAGYVVRYLIPLFFFRFIFVPAQAFFSIAHRQHLYLYRQVVQIGFVALALAWGHSTGSFEKTLLAYSCVMGFFYVLDGVFAWRIVKEFRVRIGALPVTNGV